MTEQITEQERSISEQHPSATPLVERGGERLKYPLLIASGIGTILATLSAGILLASAPASSMDEALIRSTLVGTATMSAIVAEAFFFEKQLSNEG